jgi:predicted transcriptional regulator of viral defense system
MNERDFLNTISLQQLGVFTIPYAARILQTTKAYARLYLQRLEQRQQIIRVEKGKYALPMTSIEVIASNVVLPSYISFLSGLSHYKLTTQLPRIIQIVTTKSKKSIHYENTEIQFIKLQHCFGYYREKTPEGFLFIGEKEKVIIDCVYLPKYCPLSEVIYALHQGTWDINKLITFAVQMQSVVLLKRLGYFLEQVGIDIYPKVHHHLNTRYDVLHPFLPNKGRFHAKWKLRINEDVK